jgi:hypothetical protein
MYSVNKGECPDEKDEKPADFLQAFSRSKLH